MAPHAKNDRRGARNAFIQAKSYYSIARFPAPYRSGSAICPPDMSPLKAQAYERCLECFRRATGLMEGRHEIVRIARGGRKATGYLRLPKDASASGRVPAVLVMCGGDMYKEDREKYADGAVNEGMAALVVDALGTGQTTFPHAPESVVAWQAALDALAARPEIDGNRLGAFGVSRGGLWVIRLAARVKALIACAPGGVGYLLGHARRARAMAQSGRGPCEDQLVRPARHEAARAQDHRGRTAQGVDEVRSDGAAPSCRTY